MACYGARFNSFKTWPTYVPVHLTPGVMANAGFMYEGDGDVVRCLTCGLILLNWQVDDSPMDKHANHSLLCSCVLEERERGEGVARHCVHKCQKTIEGILSRLRIVMCLEEDAVYRRSLAQMQETVVHQQKSFTDSLNTLSDETSTLLDVVQRAHFMNKRTDEQRVQVQELKSLTPEKYASTRRALYEEMRQLMVQIQEEEQDMEGITSYRDLQLREQMQVIVTKLKDTYHYRLRCSNEEAEDEVDNRAAGLVGTNYNDY